MANPQAEGGSCSLAPLPRPPRPRPGSICFHAASTHTSFRTHSEDDFPAQRCSSCAQDPTSRSLPVLENRVPSVLALGALTAAHGGPGWHGIRTDWKGLKPSVKEEPFFPAQLPSPDLFSGHVASA